MRALSEVCGWRCGKVLDIHVQASYGYLRETHYRDNLCMHRVSAMSRIFGLDMSRWCVFWSIVVLILTWAAKH